MATFNGSLGTKRYAASKSARAIGHASVRARKQAKLAQVRENASEQGRDKVYQVERTLEHFIRTQPVKFVLIGASILMVAGVGLLLGRFWMRR